MLTTQQIGTLKSELLELKEKAGGRKEETSPKRNMKEASGELSMYDNHPGDMGTALYEREKDLTLHEHADSQMKKIENALAAIENKTYGKCEVCAKEIPYERLAIVPYTTLCVEHAEAQEQSVEQDIAFNEQANPFKETTDSKAIDYENSFEEVAEFGTSDSPSDFTDSENPSYLSEDEENKSLIDQIVGQSVTDNTTEE